MSVRLEIGNRIASITEQKDLLGRFDGVFAGGHGRLDGNFVGGLGQFANIVAAALLALSQVGGG